MTNPALPMETDLRGNSWLKTNGFGSFFVNKEGGCYVYGSKKH